MNAPIIQYVVTDGRTLETIVKHFLHAAQWADAAEGTIPRVPQASRNEATMFVCSFLAAHPTLSKAALSCEEYGTHPDAGSPAAAFGHDLYLTARGFGVGFGDRAELGGTGEALTEVMRTEWRRWYIEVEQYRGWLYLTASGVQS